MSKIPPPNDDNNDFTNLFIGNLTFNTTEKELEDIFNCNGCKVKIVTAPQTGRPRGFGFVEFPTHEDALKAKNEFTGKEVDGRLLQLRWDRGFRAKVVDRDYKLLLPKDMAVLRVGPEADLPPVKDTPLGDAVTPEMQDDTEDVHLLTSQEVGREATQGTDTRGIQDDIPEVIHVTFHVADHEVGQEADQGGREITKEMTEKDDTKSPITRKRKTPQMTSPKTEMEGSDKLMMC
ncbi:cold-inducible RNA binding protein, putative [Entamoeba invadens IP1]|uniref:cold-inducible RNA binding protein, putative n=1 Tax=Entamoeba invadens IP1 TaxID=370355 RepID=UPI0002C3FA0D|nr:cold-inducible RNA binding protein, putative [Entamoeba invadens IP1]ELP93243.1 cold-inducible RNA binding protein, putative [Entamoeba invadens IP1]|eukprot:XP_004260014.1 cold-inducible RNA binding protein, putative [Entamoeba invadens IP1]